MVDIDIDQKIVGELEERMSASSTLPTPPKEIDHHADPFLSPMRYATTDLVSLGYRTPASSQLLRESTVL